MLAVVLRVLLSVFLFHPDIKTIYFQSSFLQKGVVNIYTYLVNNKSSLPLKEDFVYFPLTYFVVGASGIIDSFISGSNFNSWLANASSNLMVQDPNIFKYLLLMKLPILLLDLTTGFVLMKFFSDKRKANKALMLWLFNPFTIFILYAFSNIDIFAVLLTVIAFLFAEKKKLLPAAAILGIASCFKLYPLMFIPFLFLKGRDLREKILSVAIPIAVFLIVILPFWSQAFIQSALVSGLTTRIFNPGFNIGFGESVIVGLLLLSALFIYAWIFDKNIRLINYWIVFLLIIFSFSHFHIAWLMWIAPFLVLLAVKKPSLSLPLFTLSAIIMLIPIFYEDRSMTISLYRIYSTWFDLLPTPYLVVQKFFDPYNLQSIFHSLFAGGSFVISYLLLKDREVEAQK